MIAEIFGSCGYACGARILRLTLLITLAAVALSALPATAGAATLIDRNPLRGEVTLKVDENGTALLLYRKGALQKHVLAWGAVDASSLKFSLDFSGGWGSHRANWRKLKNVCTSLDPASAEAGLGSAAELTIAACTAPDGTKWAVQLWRRMIPNYGGTHGKVEIFLSHWTTTTADLPVLGDWSLNGPDASPSLHYQHMFGRFSFQGVPVVVGKADPRGKPLDGIGRNIYVDSLNSNYPSSSGWARVNGFLAQRPNGGFCYVFSARVIPDNSVHQIQQPWLNNARNHSGESADNAYRATASGPGVTPVVRTYWTGAVAPYDAVWQQTMAEQQATLLGEGGSCEPQYPRP